MYSIIFITLLIGIFLLLIGKGEAGFPTFQLSGVIDFHPFDRPELDPEPGIQRDLLKDNDKDQDKPDDSQPARYRSSYGEKYEYVKYLLAEKINEVVVYRKRYIDPSFSLIDCANEVGFNRSYVSRAINEEYNQNFSSLINNHRYMLLCKIVKEFPRLTRDEYAFRSGFNSITTMMRVIKHKTGLNYREWRISLQ